MLICTIMKVRLPHDMSKEQEDELTRAEVARATELQEAGTLSGLWRTSGRRGNVSFWNVRDNDHFHGAVTSLPLFKYMDIDIIPLSDHPTAIDKTLLRHPLPDA